MPNYQLALIIPCNNSILSMERAMYMGIAPIMIKGNWDLGFVLDNHVSKSVPIGENVYGHMEFETTRTELGELLFQYKYRNRVDCLSAIMEMIIPFIDSWKELERVDIVIPVPPTKQRIYQPATEIGRAIASHLGVSFYDEVLENISTVQAKNASGAIANRGIRIVANEKATKPHTILLVDDLYGTGDTLRECVKVLREDSLLRNIYVLAMTKRKGRTR